MDVEQLIRIVAWMLFMSVAGATPATTHAAKGDTTSIRQNINKAEPTAAAIRETDDPAQKQAPKRPITTTKPPLPNEHRGGMAFRSTHGPKTQFSQAAVKPRQLPSSDRGGMASRPAYAWVGVAFFTPKPPQMRGIDRGEVVSVSLTESTLALREQGRLPSQDANPTFESAQEPNELDLASFGVLGRPADSDALHADHQNLPWIQLVAGRSLESSDLSTRSDASHQNVPTSLATTDGFMPPSIDIAFFYLSPVDEASTGGMTAIGLLVLIAMGRTRREKQARIRAPV